MNRIGNMSFLRTISTVALITFIISCTHWDDVETTPKRMDVSNHGRNISIEGKWRSIALRPSLLVPRVNAVSIYCDRRALSCRQIVAKLIQKADDPLGSVDRRHLFLMEQEFRVLEWSESVVVARANPRAADIELRISLKDLAVELTVRETGARGAIGSDPNLVGHWVLD
jgi:hypothetical protein